MQLTRPLRCVALSLCTAGVAQLVEHHLAKVDVESSSLFARSIFSLCEKMSRRSWKSEGGQNGILKNLREFSGGFFAHVLRGFHEI
jgi:hypothetical protein